MEQVTRQEQEFIVRLRSRDKDAFGRLYDDYSPALFGIVKKILKSEELAEDVLQNSFLKIWNHIESYDPAKGRLFSWMLNIARNTALDILRSQAYKASTKIQKPDSIVSMADDGSTMRRTDTIGVSELVGSLEPAQLEVIHLIYYQGYTHAEAAEELGLPLGTVKTRVRMALIQLRKKMKQ